MTTTTAPGWRYVPALDGLRALAIVAVVLFHYWPTAVPGGFIGVDVFFVLSGYLITGILLDEISRTSTVGLRAFWRRRTFRLMPPVVVLVAVTSLVALRTSEMSTRGLVDAIGSLTWTTNWLQVATSGWRVIALNPHTMLSYMWSLAVEEQFYLLWPVVLGFVVVKRRRPAQIAIVAVLAAASIAVMGLAAHNDAYTRTDSRAFELLFGALLAITAVRVPKRVAGAAASVALVAMVVIATQVRSIDAWLYPWGFVLIAGLGAVLVVAAIDPPAWLGAALGARPVQALGRVSYGVYLWHVPVALTLSRARIGWSGVPLVALRLAALAVVVAISYHFVERPFRTGAVPRAALALFAAWLLAAGSLVPLALAARRDAAAQWDPPTAPPAAAGRTKVLVLGDLVGELAADVLADDDRLAVWNGADTGCQFADGVDAWVGGHVLRREEVCTHWHDRWRRAVDRFRPDVVVIGAGFWDGMPLRRNGTPLSPAEVETTYRALLDRELAVATAHGATAVVVQIDDWSKLVDDNMQSAADRATSTALYNRALDDAVAARSGTRTITVSGTPSWDEMRRAAEGEWPSVVRSSA